MAAPPPPAVAFNSGPRFSPTNMAPQHPGPRQGAPQSPVNGGFAMDQGYRYSAQHHQPNHVQQQAAPAAFTGIHQSHLPSNHTPPPTPSASTWSSFFGPQLQQQMAQVQHPAQQMSIPHPRHHSQQLLHNQFPPGVQSALPSLPQSLMQMHLASPIIPPNSLPDVKAA